MVRRCGIANEIVLVDKGYSCMIMYSVLYEVVIHCEDHKIVPENSV